MAYDALSNDTFNASNTFHAATCNSFSNCSTTGHSNVMNLVEITGEILIAILAIFGNGLVLVAIATTTSLQTVTNYYVSSLAAADLLVGLIGIPCVIVAFNGLPTNFVGCLIVNSCIIVLTQISIFGLLIVALERFYAIKYPYYYYRHCTTKTTIAAVTLTWTAGVIVGMVPIFGWNRGKMAAFESGSTCTFTGVIDMEYMVYMNFFGFVLPPLLAMFSIYGYIYTVVRKQIRKIYSLQMRMVVNQNTPPPPPSPPPPPVTDANQSHAPVNTVSKTVQDTQVGNETETRLEELENEAAIPLEELASSQIRMNGTDAVTPSTVDQVEIGQRTTTPTTDPSCIAGQTTLAVNGLNSTEFSQTSPKRRSNGIKNNLSQQNLMMCPNASTSSESFTTTVVRKSVSGWKKEIRAAKWFAVVLSVFAGCWLPLHIMNCVTVFGGTTCVPCVTSAVILSHLNSAVNPILYAYSNSKFSAAFRRMLRLKSAIPGALVDSICAMDRAQR